MRPHRFAAVRRIAAPCLTVLPNPRDKTMRFISVTSLVLATTLTGAVLFAAAPAQTLATKPSTRPAAAAPVAAPIAAEVFELDSTHSKALFRILHLGAGPFWGRFNDVSGTMTCADGKPEGVMFDVTIKTDSVDTGTEKLDAHLKSGDFFNAKEHPALTFKSTSIKKGPKDGWLEVAGDLSMNGVTKPVTAMLEWTGTNDGPMGRRAGYEATINIKRSDWNVKYGVDKGMIGDDVRIIVGLEGVAKK